MVEEIGDITLAEIAERLERDHGEKFAPSTVHNFFRRHGWTFKKRSGTPTSRTAPTSSGRGLRGSLPSPTSTPSG